MDIPNKRRATRHGPILGATRRDGFDLSRCCVAARLCGTTTLRSLRLASHQSDHRRIDQMGVNRPCILRVRKSGVLSRHRHPMAVCGYVLKGSWRYLEHDWIAEEGGFVYEPPGEVHTLVVDEDVEEMITLFNVNGAMIYVDEKGETVGYEDVFTKMEMCRKHYAKNGLGADYVNQFVR